MGRKRMQPQVLDQERQTVPEGEPREAAQRPGEDGPHPEASAPAPAAEEPEERPEKSRSKKKELVQAAIDAGHDMPKDGVAWIKENFGVEMNPQTFSVTKSGLKTAAGESGVHRTSGAATKRSSKAAPADTGLDSVEAARAVKELVDRYGKDVVKGFADLF
jgi:hypothetical protein